MRLYSLPSLALAALLTAQAATAADTFFTVGPMVHLNWGRGETHLSYAVELSFWTPTDAFTNPVEDEDPLVGFDIGLEYGASKFRLYSEAQAGFYYGGSMGPYLEFTEGELTGYGVQSSVWGLLVLGMDLRARYGTSGFVFSPGLMAKVGSCLDTCEM